MTLRVAYLVKRSSWSAIREQGSASRMQELVRRKDPTVARLKSTHDAHERTVEEVLSAFESLGVQATAIGPRTRDITSSRYSLVVTIGGDGTLLRASHRVADVPVLGINSAPLSSVGFFCGVTDGDVLPALERALDGRLPSRTLTRMAVTIEGKLVTSRVLNDALFCHQSPAATSRYLIEVGGLVEEHKSSGFWIGPAAGSTAAQRSAGGRVLPLQSTALQLVVREPYTPKGERFRLVKVLAKDDERIIVRSKMREAALFLDGPDVVVHPRFGDVITFQKSSEPLQLLGSSARQR
ncbi:MAG: NAD(+)/NADH kinase [Polyangiaceae bacterium]|jgi:NAD+ kinase|nr:NAD(+)/NADH kinase [Polyangiaceae bacterium]MBK8942385.1 NAD(+)/NADH kinase [Polyangiaceae bacterium]